MRWRKGIFGDKGSLICAYKKILIVNYVQNYYAVMFHMSIAAHVDTWSHCYCSYQLENPPSVRYPRCQVMRYMCYTVVNTPHMKYCVIM